MLQVGIDCEVSQEIIIVPTENKHQTGRKLQKFAANLPEPFNLLRGVGGAISRGQAINTTVAEWLDTDWPNLMLCSVLVSGGSLNI